jgi:Transmembrane secretion effector
MSLTASPVMSTWSALVPDITPLRGPGARGFRAIFASRTVAYLGSQAAEVALLVQAQRLTRSPLVVGTLGLAELVPLVVFGLYGGVLADRLDRRALMRWCEPGLAGCALLLALNALLPRPLLWPLYVLAALVMALASLQRPAFEAATPRVVPGGQLVYALDAAGFMASFVLLGRLPKLPPAVEEDLTEGRNGGGPDPGRTELLAGLRYALTRPDLLGSYLACLTLAGGADEVSGVFRDVMWKQSIPDHLRGRMAGVELLSYAAGPPAGQLRSGAVAAVTSVRFSLTSGGLACTAAVALISAALPAFRRCAVPAPGPGRAPDTAVDPNQ